MFDISLVTLFLVKHMIITFNPNNPNNNAMKEVPNLHFLDELLRNSLPKNFWTPHDSCVMKVAHCQATGLITIPKLVSSQFACVRQAKNTLLRYEGKRNACLINLIITPSKVTLPFLPPL
jgi:hypothetical protein